MSEDNFSMTWPKHNLPQSTVEPTNHCATLGSADTVRICYFRKTKLKRVPEVRKLPGQNAEIMLWTFHIYLLHEQEFAPIRGLVLSLPNHFWLWVHRLPSNSSWLLLIYFVHGHRHFFKELYILFIDTVVYSLCWACSCRLSAVCKSSSLRIVTQNSPRMTCIPVSTISDREPGAPSARLRKEANFCCINFVATREPLSRLRRNAKVVEGRHPWLSPGACCEAYKPAKASHPVVKPLLLPQHKDLKLRLHTGAKGYDNFIYLLKGFFDD